MKCAVAVFVLFTFFVFTEAWVAIQPKDRHYKGNATCFMEDLGEFEDGETKRYPNRCVIATCGHGGDLDIIGCCVVRVSPPCYVTDGDLSLPHPKCCYKVICPEDNTI